MAIETKRLLLRKFVLSDAEAVFELSSHPLVTKYTGDAGLVKSLKDAESIITDVSHADYEQIGYGRLALVEKESHRVIGFCGLKYLTDFKKTDLGYRMLPKYWGRGYATESSRAVLDYAESSMNLTEIIGIADVENLASQKVLQKLGFAEIDEIKVDGLLAKLFQLKFPT